MKRASLAMTVVLLVVWLLLNSTAAIGQIVLGTALGMSLVAAAAPLRPLRSHLRRADVAVRLFFSVLIDIVQSNFAVARIILGLVRNRNVRSGFMTIPLELRDPHALAVLAMIITSTPGTVWQGLSADRRELTIHVLDLVDEGHWVLKIKQRYEEPLRDIFE
jgi:multicomponent K+:H+ antiporter subunit E